MSGTKTVYLAGPMRGLPEFNYPAFESAAKELRNRGYLVWSPHEQTEDKTLTLREYMKHDLPAVLEADTVVLLPGWSTSAGARLEWQVASTCGIEVRKLEDLLEISNEGVSN